VERLPGYNALTKIEMSLTIVITTYNRARVLEDLLYALENQTESDFQVVVAIDGSTDTTEEMLAGVTPTYDMKWVDTGCDGYGLAVARNRGILAADGRAVVVLDDDSFPDPGFVAAHKSSVVQGVMTGGPRVPNDARDTILAEKMARLSCVPPLTPMTVSEFRHEWPRASLVENNLCMLREDWISAGLFSERLKMYGFIGQEFFARAAYLGIRWQYNPEAIIRHHGEIAGDNGLSDRRKRRQTRLAQLLRPSLMTPRHFDAQVAWARAQEEGRDIALPSFHLQAGFMLPYRAVRRSTSEAAKSIRRRFQR